MRDFPKFGILCAMSALKLVPKIVLRCEIPIFRQEGCRIVLEGWITQEALPIVVSNREAVGEREQV